MNPGKPRIGPWLLCLAVVIADQVVKRIVVSTMQLHQSIPVLGDVVRLTYIHNDGLVFGIDIPSSKLLGWLIAHGVVSLIAAIAVFYLLLKMHNDPKGVRWVLAGVLGGAIGNTIDRLAYGYVIDYVDVDLPNWLMERWPVFNIADAAVSVGITVLILLLLFRPGPAGEREGVAEELAADVEAAAGEAAVAAQRLAVPRAENPGPVTAAGDGSDETGERTSPLVEDPKP